MSTFISKVTKGRFAVADNKESPYEGARLGEMYDKVPGSSGVASRSGSPDAPHTPFEQA